MPKLIVSLGSLAVLALPLGPKPIRLGRSSDNDVILPLPEVADFHALLTPEGEEADLEAQPGESFVHEGRLVARVRLRSRTRVALGGYRLHLLDLSDGLLADGLNGPVPAGGHTTVPLDPVGVPPAVDTPG